MTQSGIEPIPAPTQVGVTVWSAPNPFGEPTAFALVHPEPDVVIGGLEELAGGLGLKRLDAEGDIPWIGTDVLYASLRAMQVELCHGSDVWVSGPVSDDWTGNAVGRRYVVLTIGLDPLPDPADAAEIADYLTRRDRIWTGLVKIRVRMTQD